jgi:hypothetical protein
MTDNVQDYFNFLGAILAAVFGWLGKTIWNAVQTLKDDLRELERHIPESYVSKSDFQRHEDRVISYLERIEQKIDRKADKE